MSQPSPENPIPSAVRESARDLHAAGAADDVRVAEFAELCAPGTEEGPSDAIRMDPSTFTAGLVAVSTNTVYLLFYSAEDGSREDWNTFHTPCEAYSSIELLEARRKELGEEDEDLEFHVKKVELDRSHHPFRWKPKTKTDGPTSLS